MAGRFDTDLLVVGFGSAGMTAAELAADLGLRVTVVERARPGGDCLWTGCVPSKALIAAASVARQMRAAPSFGLPAPTIEVDLPAVWRKMREVRDEIARGDDDPARFEALGVRVRRGEARLVGPHAVAVTDDRGAMPTVTARIILLCTGGRPVVPAVAGLREVGYLTNETLFELERCAASGAVHRWRADRRRAGPGVRAAGDRLDGAPGAGPGVAAATSRSWWKVSLPCWWPKASRCAAGSRWCGSSRVRWSWVRSAVRNGVGRRTRSS